MLGKNGSDAVSRLPPDKSDAALSRTMSRVIILAAMCCLAGMSAKPVRRTLNFNMFVLKPSKEPERSILATEGLSRFGPVLEYLVQRVQNMMSVRLPPNAGFYSEPAVDADNEVDGLQSRMPGVVVRPSRTKPGTYEVEIDVVVDDGQPHKPE
ncbi:unnamed protein product [Leptidea sinapis]|uniref:Uncharacterized protein n=1 Tax=Leptidea sinapis TaxID=189913 RepID=A0A5E4PYT1_9NEOP|nr:unnamed protein product [Leptidea sinapis]